MANELKIRFSYEYKKGGGKPHKNRGYQSITVSGNNVQGLTVQAIGTSAETLGKPADMGTIGWVYLHNLDATNYIDLGDDADSPSIQLKATEECIVRWNATDVSAKADTASCDLEYELFED